MVSWIGHILAFGKPGRSHDTDAPAPPTALPSKRSSHGLFTPSTAADPVIDDPIIQRPKESQAHDADPKKRETGESHLEVPRAPERQASMASEPAGLAEPDRPTPTANPSSARDTRAKVVIIGHSHIGCVKEAYDLIENDLDRPFHCVPLQLLRPDIPYMVNENGRIIYNRVIDPEVKEFLAREQPDIIVLMLEGQQTAAQGFLYPTHRPYDFCLPGQEFVRVMEGDYIPYNLMLGLVSRRFLHIDDFISRIKEFFECPVIAIAPPPVSGDDTRVRNMLQRNETIRKSVDEHGLPSALWRWKMWRIHVTAMRDMYDRQGIPFHEPPDEAFQDGRFIEPRFISDAFHGNPAYGSLILRQIQQIISPTREV